MPPRRRLRELSPDPVSPDSVLEPTSSGSVLRRKRGPLQDDRSPWPRRLAWLAGGLFGFVLIAPNLIGWLGLQQAAIDWALADFDGKVQVRQLTLGWFQPITASGITVTDGTGQPLAEVESFRSTQRLGGFLFNRQLGHFEIQRPQLHLLIRYGGSNLEDALAQYLAQPASGGPTAVPPATLEVRDGLIEVAGSQTQDTVRIQGIAARIETGTSLAALVGKVEAQLINGRDQGAITAQLQCDPNTNFLNFDAGNIEIALQQFPLGGLGPLLKRVINRIELAGQLNGKVNLQFVGGGRQAVAQLEQMRLDRAIAVAPDLLGTDEFNLQQLSAQGELGWADGTASANQFQARCDFGQLAANGTLALADLTQLAGTGRLARTPFQLEGQLDLARIASLLPQTLHLHSDLRFDSGEMQFQVLSKPQSDSARLLVNVDTTNFVAHRGAQPIVWQQPLRLVADIIQREGLPKLDQLLCRSDFLSVEGTADLQQANLKLAGDLAKLQQQLGQFLDLSGWQLAGTMAGELGWQLAPDAATVAAPGRGLQSLAWSNRLAIEQPLIGLPGQPIWTESRIELDANGTAAVDADARCSLLSGSGAVRLGAEQLQWRLTEPVVDLATAPRWAAECTLTGSLGRWLQQIRPWIDLTTLGIAGESSVRTLVTLQWPVLELRNLDYQVEQFEFNGYGLKVNEPKLQGQVQAAIDLQQGLAQVADLTLTSSALAARGEKLQAGYRGNALQLGGSLGFRADINRLAGWFNLSPAADSVQYFGTAEGALNFGSTPTSIAAQFEALVPELLAAQPVTPAAATPGASPGWTELLKENNVRVAGQIGLSPDFRSLAIEQVGLKCDSLNVAAKGTINDLTGQLVSDLGGTWSPNWERINGLLGAYSYQMVQLEGRQTQAFAIRGPLLAAAGQPTALSLPLELTAQTQLGWERGQVFHLPVGPANLEATLAEGVATLNTGEIPFSEGRLHLVPKIDFRSASPLATLDPGPLAENIQLTPEICRDWLKYVAPLLADATSAQGRVSISTEGVAVPLADPLNGRVRGQVNLQQVTIGAGPLAKQLIDTIQGVRSLLKPNQAESRDLTVWMQLEQQTVPFAVENRRVYHEGLAMHVSDFTIRTKGSVGLDQTLAMVAEIPIADDWIGNEPWLQGLKGQSLQIPVGGTVSRPVIDTKAIQQLTMQLVQRTAANQLNNVVGEQTQKLQSKVDTELNKLQNDLRSKINSGLGDKLPPDLQNGFNGLFGPKKDK